MRILILDGHPAAGSLIAALADRYAEGALAAGHEVQRLNLRELAFDPNLALGYKTLQSLEPDLVRAQEAVSWCEHLVVAYPVWWGSLPALLKGFFDRAFLPGFAFKYHRDDPFWDRLLAGRSARLIVTSDAPRLYTRLYYRDAPIVSVQRAILRFCGFKPVRVSAFGSIKQSKPARIEGLLDQVFALGRQGR